MEITRRSLIQGSAGLALASMLPIRAWADAADSGYTTSFNARREEEGTGGEVVS